MERYGQKVLHIVLLKVRIKCTAVGVKMPNLSVDVDELEHPF